MKRLALLVCSLALVCVTTAASAAPVLPWTTFSGPMVKAVVGSPQLGTCGRPETELLVAAFRHADVVFMMVFSPVTGRIAFFYDPTPEAQGDTFTYVGIGQIVPERHDEIPVLRWSAYDPRLHKDICNVMYPRES